MNTKDKLIKKCKQVADLLIQKNEAYGDSALNPAGIFSKLKASEALKIRLDDKLKRIQNVGVSDETEDTLMDCAGYMVLLMIALDNESNNIQECLREEGTTSHTAGDSTKEDTVGEVWFSDSTGT
jgi:hypothetical protein|tara:strand:- start:225 stop:599 length:375 start_codon:yes stop_codon:yes gene_type:complete